MAVVLVFALASAGLAYQNELIGFRGLKWDDPPTKDIEYLEKPTGGAFAYMIYPYLFPLYGDDVVFHTRRNDKLQIGIVKLEYIFYLFYKDKLMEIRIKPKLN